MIKILIVDDSVFSQRITANLVKKNMPEVEVHFANDGKDGLEKYELVKPDYVFVDLLMPHISGRELICLLKEKDPAAKIIVISADVQKNVRKEVESYDVMGFLNKPFDDEKAQLVCTMIREDRNA